jgi:hypothetical protein
MKREPLMVMVDAEELRLQGRLKEARDLLKSLVDELDDREMEKRLYAAQQVIQLGAQLYLKTGIRPDQADMVRYATIGLQCYERLPPEKQTTFRDKYGLSTLNEVLHPTQREAATVFARCLNCGKRQSILNSMFCPTCDEYVCQHCIETGCPACGTKLVLAKLGPEHKRYPMDYSKPEAKSGCFIATAVYGSRLAPEVVALTRFRDETLLHIRFGAALVHLYCAVSPFFASLVRRHRLLRSLTRNLLIRPILTLLKIGEKIGTPKLGL